MRTACLGHVNLKRRCPNAHLLYAPDIHESLLRVYVKRSGERLAIVPLDEKSGIARLDIMTERVTFREEGRLQS